MRSTTRPLHGRAGQQAENRCILFDANAVASDDVTLGILCVFCLRDLEFLLMQARSIARYSDRSTFRAIYLIWNDEAELPAARARELREILGPFHLRLLDASDFGLRPAANDGWIAQQALKLLAARAVEESHYLVLDAKNHFIAPATAADFLTFDGQALQPVAHLRGASARSLAFCLDYFGLDAAANAPRAALNVTPFVFETAKARELVSFVEGKEHCPLDEFLHSFSGHPDRITEFMLYQAFAVLRDGSLDLFAAGAKANSETLWSYEIEHRQTAEWIARVEANPSIRIAGVHWLACMNMSSVEREMIAGFWQRQGLVKTRAQALEITNSVVKRASSGDRAFAQRRRAAAPRRR